MLHKNTGDCTTEAALGKWVYKYHVDWSNTQHEVQKTLCICLGCIVAEATRMVTITPPIRTLLKTDTVLWKHGVL